MAIIIDFNGFRESSDGFIVKELAGIYMNFEGESCDQLAYFIFSPPYSAEDLPSEYRQHNLWCEQKYHGIPWGAGNIPFHEVGDVLEVLLRKVECIYVRGKEKKRWLTRMIAASKMIIDLWDIGCNGVAERLEYSPTFYHSDYHPEYKDYVCAYENVQMMKKWFVKNISLSPSIIKSIKLFSVTRGLRGMLPEDVALLPKGLILGFARDDINDNWYKLSIEQKSDDTIASHQRCSKHNPHITHTQDDIHQIFPYRSFCLGCMEEDDKTFDLLRRFGLSKTSFVKLLERTQGN